MGWMQTMHGAEKKRAVADHAAHLGAGGGSGLSTFVLLENHLKGTLPSCVPAAAPQITADLRWERHSSPS